MYTPRAIFSRLFLQICPIVLSLYALGRLVTLSCEISDQSPITCVNSHYRLESEGRVWSVYIDDVNPKMRLKDMAMWIYKMAAKYNCLIHRPRKPHPRTKHAVDRTTCRWVMAIWNFPIGGLRVNRPWGRSSVTRSVGRSSIYTSYTVLCLCNKIKQTEDFLIRKNIRISSLYV